MPEMLHLLHLDSLSVTISSKSKISYPKNIENLKFLALITSQLDDNERKIYRQQYQKECSTMVGFAQRFREEGIQQGKQQGMQQGMQLGEANLLIKLLEAKFGAVTELDKKRLRSADSETLVPTG